MSSATFCNIPLFTTFDAHQETSRLSLDWVLETGLSTVRSVATGIVTVPGVQNGFSVQMDLTVTASLPFDLVLGRNWLQYCRETVPESCLVLSSGVIDLRRRPFVLMPHTPPPSHSEHDSHAGQRLTDPASNWRLPDRQPSVTLLRLCGDVDRNLSSVPQQWSDVGGETGFTPFTANCTPCIVHPFNVQRPSYTVNDTPSNENVN
ncbi:hypothetical protein K438DRAFT_2018486, partial [Mycena galopus ATCC 62051]